jgi:hypothetical protein
MLVIAGAIQATIGNRIPAWTGNKNSHVALGLLTIALGASVLVAARTLHSDTARRPETALRPETAVRPETLVAITLWLTVVALVCSTTVGRLSILPVVVLLGAAGFTFVACGWPRLRAVVATHWLRGLLGLLGGFDVLMAVSAGSVAVVAAGLVAGASLIGAAILDRPKRRTLVLVSGVLQLPFVALTWWTIITPLLAVVAVTVGLAATRRTGAVDAPISDETPSHAALSAASAGANYSV